MMALIPTGAKERWTTRARRSAKMTLKSLLEFREMVPEYRAEGVLMQAYKEAAEAMLISDETLRDLMGKIRAYPAEKLVYWLDNGVSFDHMEKAHLVSELSGRTPEQLLDEAVTVGNEHGKTMTADEMTAFALGVVDKPKRNVIYHFLPLYDRLGKFPTRFKWDDEKTNRYFGWLDKGKEFFA